MLDISFLSSYLLYPMLQWKCLYDSTSVVLVEVESGSCSIRSRPNAPHKIGHGAICRSPGDVTLSALCE